MPGPRSLHARPAPSDGDRCPGALRLHDAADGPLARIRVPGGRVTSEQVADLADLAETLGDGRLHVTARGNLELRAVRDAAALTSGLLRVGMLPSSDHERVRNVVASTTGRLDPLVSALDRAICAHPTVAELSGRFLFGLDGGEGDVSALHPDIAAVLRADDSAALVVGGRHTGSGVGLADVAAALTAGAAAFVANANGAWRVRDLPESVGAAAGSVQAAMVHAIGAAVELRPDGRSLPVDAGHGPALGVREAGTALVAGLLLGAASAEAWRALARVATEGDGLVRLTPWRRVVVAGLAADSCVRATAVLHGHGFVVDDADPATGLGACTGRPGCARALADVRADALRSLSALTAITAEKTPPAVPSGPAGPIPSREHPVYWAGCARACGHPVAAHTRVVATGAGYSFEHHR